MSRKNRSILGSIVIVNRDVRKRKIGCPIKNRMSRWSSNFNIQRSRAFVKRRTLDILFFSGDRSSPSNQSSGKVHVKFHFFFPKSGASWNFGFQCTQCWCRSCRSYIKTGNDPTWKDRLNPQQTLIHSFGFLKSHRDYLPLLRDEVVRVATKLFKSYGPGHALFRLAIA